MTGEESYRLLAEHYDAIHEAKPYEREAVRILAHLDGQLEQDGDALLDVACGTGRHIAEFTHDFDCVGIDANAGMLRLARQRVPEASFVQAEMQSFQLDHRFDALTCLFGSIGYLQTWANLEQAIGRFAEHLREDGAFVVESWLAPTSLKTPARKLRYHESEQGDWAIARIAIAYPPEQGVSEIEIEWLIAEEAGGIRSHSERQRLGVFETDTVLTLMEKHGLEATVDEQGLTDERVRVVGRRRK